MNPGQVAFIGVVILGVIVLVLAMEIRAVWREVNELKDRIEKAIK